MKKKYVAWYFGNTDEIIELEANYSYGLIMMIVQRDLWVEDFDLCYLGVI